MDLTNFKNCVGSECTYSNTKGERIFGLFSELHNKIKNMEEARVSKKGSQVTDEQMGLLKAQLKYVRKVMKNKTHEFGPGGDFNSTDCVDSYSDDSRLDYVPVKLQNDNMETQTSKISLENSVPQEIMQLNKSKSLPRVSNKSEPVEHVQTTQNAKITKDMKTHYHLKLSDVPFIVGTSAGASHSVIANVQNIIGIMKTHNKGLCSNNPRMTSSSAPKDEQLSILNLKKGLMQLSNELSSLTVKQENLKKKLELKARKVDTESVYEEYMDVSKLIEGKAKEISSFHSAIDDIKLTQQQKGSKNVSVQPKKPEFKKGEQLKKIYLKNRTSTVCTKPNVKVIKKNRLMNSLKTLKHQLQVEDIVWT